MHHELCQRCIERPILEGKLLGNTMSHLNRRVTFLHRDHEGLRRIDRHDGPSPQPCHQLGSQRPRTATDIEHPMSRLKHRQISEQHGERHRVPTHEPVVRIGTNGEAHERKLHADARTRPPNLRHGTVTTAHIDMSFV